MNGLKDNFELYMFFLLLTPKLPKYFFAFAKFFSELNIKLIPISLDDLMTVSKGKKNYIIVVNRDIQSNAVFRRMRRRYLDMALINNKFTLFEISSFDRSFFLSDKNKKGIYHHFKLPEEVENICEKIYEVIYNDRKSQQTWPGGKRGTVPPLKDV